MKYDKNDVYKMYLKVKFNVIDNLKNLLKNFKKKDLE